MARKGPDEEVIKLLKDSAGVHSKSSSGDVELGIKRVFEDMHDNNLDILPRADIIDIIANAFKIGLPEATAFVTRRSQSYSAELLPNGDEDYKFKQTTVNKATTLIAQGKRITAWEAIAEFMDNILDNFKRTKQLQKLVEKEDADTFPIGYTPPENLEVIITMGLDEHGTQCLTIDENSGGIPEAAFDALINYGDSYAGDHVGGSVSAWGMGTKIGLCALGRFNVIWTWNYKYSRGTRFVWDQPWYEEPAMKTTWEPARQHMNKDKDKQKYFGKTIYVIKQVTEEGLRLFMDPATLAATDKELNETLGIDGKEGSPSGAQALQRWLSRVLSVKISDIELEFDTEVNISIVTELNIDPITVDEPFSAAISRTNFNPVENCMILMPNNDPKPDTVLMNIPGFEPMALEKTTQQDVELVDVNGEPYRGQVDVKTTFIFGLLPQTLQHHAGLYWWGNGRLFEVAEKNTLSSGKGRTGLGMKKFGSQNSKLVGFVFLDCVSSKAIPWEPGKKWGLSSNELNVEIKRFLRDYACAHHNFAGALNIHGTFLEPWRDDYDETKEGAFRKSEWPTSIGTYAKPIDVDNIDDESQLVKNRLQTWGGSVKNLNYAGSDTGTPSDYRLLLQGLLDSHNPAKVSYREIYRIFQPEKGDFRNVLTSDSHKDEVV